MRINQNTMAMNAYRSLSTNNMSLGKSLEKLSSGFRINRAADDAAGLVISQGLRAQIGGLRQATRNAQDGISVVQTAEGALNEVHTILGRMRDLAVQAANTGTNDADARSAAQAEITALSAEVNRISSTTAFGGKKLLDGSYGQTLGTASATLVANDNTADVTLTIGSDASTVTVAADADANTVRSAVISAVNAGTATHGITAAAGSGTGEISYTNNTGSAVTVAVTAAASDVSASVGAAAGTPAQFQIGANAADTLSVTIGQSDASTLGIGTIDVTSSTGASAAITALDGAIKSVSTQRGDLGALQNRFESMINNLQVTTENLVSSESRIRDTDMAAEMTSFTKSQILSQASTAMLAQANQVPQSVLSLLR